MFTDLYQRPYLGCIATHGVIGEAMSAVNNFFMTRSLHVASDSITALQLVFANFAMNSNGEIPGGTTATYTASIEYPAGTFTQVFFAGSTSGAAVSGALLVSDPVAVAIPVGASFFVRNYRVHAAGSFAAAFTPFGSTLGNAAGDVCHFGTSSAVTDQTLGGTITNSSGTTSSPPAAIIGMTGNPSAFLIGDSRIVGAGGAQQTTPTNPAIGETEMPFFPFPMGSIRAGCTSDQAIFWVRGRHSLAQALGNAYCSAVLSNHSINDIETGISAAQLAGRHQVIGGGLFPTKRYYVCTLDPYTMSTDSWATVANQTPQNATFELQRVAYNTLLRNGGFSGMTGFFDLAAVTESSMNSGRWIANGTPQFYTAEGLHPTFQATALLLADQAINPALLVR